MRSVMQLVALQAFLAVVIGYGLIADSRVAITPLRLGIIVSDGRLYAFALRNDILARAFVRAHSNQLLCEWAITDADLAGRWWIDVSIWWFAALGELAVATHLIRIRPIWKNRVPGYCDKCSYNLTGNVSGVCPECGAEV